jgi:hypothetical protein
MRIEATLIEIRKNEEMRRVAGKIHICDPKDKTAPKVLYEFEIDKTREVGWPITVSKDGCDIYTAAYYDPKSFLGVCPFRKTAYWLVWNVIMHACRKGDWVIPTTMSLRLGPPDVSKIIMSPNALAHHLA